MISCDHGLQAWHNPATYEIVYQHGRNPEAVKVFTDKELTEMSEGDILRSVDAWLREVHEYEKDRFTL